MKASHGVGNVRRRLLTESLDQLGRRARDARANSKSDFSVNFHKLHADVGRITLRPSGPVEKQAKASTKKSGGEWSCPFTRSDLRERTTPLTAGFFRSEEHTSESSN